MNIAIDTTRFTAAGLDFVQEGDDGVFRLIIDGEPAPHVLVRVKVAGTDLVFVPERSAAQRQVLGLLGETVPSFG